MAPTSEPIKLLQVHSGVIFEPGEPEDHALGSSRGGFGTKINLLTDGNGLPLAVELKPGQAHEINSFENLLDSVRVIQPRGAPKKRPDALAGDKGFSAEWTRTYLASYDIEDVAQALANSLAMSAPVDYESVKAIKSPREIEGFITRTKILNELNQSASVV